MNSRRDFLKKSITFSAAALAARPLAFAASPSPVERWFDISLAQWSLHRAFKGGELDALDFAKIAIDEFGIRAVEYVNQFYAEGFSVDVAKDLKRRADDAGVKSLLIMCDGLGSLGDVSDAKRHQAVDNHKLWIDGASIMGCHSIRVNARSEGSYEEQQKLASDGLRKLTEVGAESDISVIVENHGGLSSNGAWLSKVIEMVDHPNCGTLPDFGNFTIDWKTGESYDRYKGAEELMPYAKGVSAKAHDFDADGFETHTDYPRMLKIVKDAGYRGYLGIEYEGKELGEFEGIRATQALLRKQGGR